MRFIFQIIFILLLGTYKSHSEEKFVNGLEDIPLFKDMLNNFDSLVLFDSSEGRVVSTEAFGKVKIKDVEDFYKSILPNLGWVKSKSNHFSRGNESLEIRFSTKENITIVQFSLMPKNK